MSVFVMHVLLAVAAALSATTAAEAPSVRFSGLEYFEGTRGCPLVDRAGGSFACLEARPSTAGQDISVAFVGLDGRVGQRVTVYSGPPDPRPMFTVRKGLRSVNQRLARDGFAPLRRLSPKALRVVDGALVRVDGTLFRFGADRPVRRWRTPALGPWARCRSGWSVAGAASDTGDGSRRLVVSLRALRRVGPTGAAACAVTPGEPPGADASDAPYAYMVMAASGDQVRVSVPPVLKGLDRMCRRVLACVGAIKGAPAGAKLARRLRDASRSTCTRTLERFRRHLSRSGVKRFPAVCQ